MNSRKSIIKKSKKIIMNNEPNHAQLEIERQQLEHQKRLAEEEYKKQLEEQKLELIEDCKLKLFKLNRNLKINIEKEKLLQQKINEMLSDID